MHYMLKENSVLKADTYSLAAQGKNMISMTEKSLKHEAKNMHSSNILSWSSTRVRNRNLFK